MFNFGTNLYESNESPISMSDVVDVLSGDDCVDLDSRQYNEMSKLFNMIEYSSDEKIAIQFLSNDQTFVDCFGTIDPKKELIRHMEASNEHLLQDFLRWGVFGMIAGSILSRLERIRSICAKAKLKVDQEKFDNWDARSIYLPPAQKMKLIMEGLEELADGLEGTIKSKNFDLMRLSDSLRKCGIDVHPVKGNVSKIITTDWKAVAGDWVGSVLLAGVGLVTNLFGLITTGVISGAGGSIGAHMASENGGTLADKGYTKVSLVSYADRMVHLIDRVYILKNLKNQQGVHEDAENLTAKLRFVKQAINVLTHTIKNIGRGLAAAIVNVS